MGFSRIIYIKVLIISILPIVFFIVCYCVWAIISCRNRDPKLLKTRAISSVVILLFFIHPNIVQYMFDMFNCIKIEGTDRMKNDLEVLCYQGAHYVWALFVALPSIIIWGLGIPLFATLLIFRERKSLDSVTTREKYGFLFRGYKKKFFFWESMVMYRKIALIFISVFIGQYGLIV